MQGQFLFRWRSYIPLIMFSLVVFSLQNYRYFGGGPGTDIIWKVFCLFISLTGLFIRIITVGHIHPGTSGRNTKYQEADNLNIAGMYSIVRNPLYLGNIIMYMGVIFISRDIAFAAVFLAVLVLYYERIIYTEECFLLEKYGAAYSDWAGKTPLLLPTFSNYKKTGSKFNWKLVLRKEFSGIFAVAVVFFMIDFISNYFASGKFSTDIFWTVYLSVNMVFYLGVLYLKKKTRILTAPV